MDYDYEKFCEIISALVAASWDVEYTDELVIGDNISPISEVKVIFDGFGDLEYEDEDGEYVYEEGGNRDMISFAVFLHRNTTKGEEFPEHEMTPWALIHRPKEEVCVYVWYDAENDEYEVLPVEDSLNTVGMTGSDIEATIDYLKENYFNENYRFNSPT